MLVETNNAVSKKFADIWTVLKKLSITFPLGFELLIWLLYVCFYKYSYYLESAGLPRVLNNDFPYLEICIYSFCSTLYLIPFYRWLVPKLLFKKKYGWLVLITFIYFVFVSYISNTAVAWLFCQFTRDKPVYSFFNTLTNGFYLDWNIILTDSMAFLSIAFSRFSYQNELKRHKVETDHLQLQLHLLKTQLQPHFLFNTLNSLYGLSLTGSKDTPRYILLLSQMMQYILYDCDKEEIDLADELVFMQGYFELEQKKFPNSKILLKLPDYIPSIKIPPLLFLPLVENSFKHGKHKLENDADVIAELIFEKETMFFRIENEILPFQTTPFNQKKGGIGLVNIKKRLELYYPNLHELTIGTVEGKYIANLRVKVS